MSETETLCGEPMTSAFARSRGAASSVTARIGFAAPHPHFVLSALCADASHSFIIPHITHVALYVLYHPLRPILDVCSSTHSLRYVYPSYIATGY
jgi:hypothetical protein